MKLYVCISLDVEEEGLFSGSYASKNLSVDNVAHLPRLAPLYQDLGFAVTLFCAHSVFADENAAKTILWMRDHCGCEIAGHLHHWSTPPADNAPYATSPPVRTHILPQQLLKQRLNTLLTAGREIIGHPITSFRMGRWDLKNILFPMLANSGIKVDSSVCPLRVFPNGPNHFLAPADPYWVAINADMRILEAPVTQIPLIKQLAKLWHVYAPGKYVDYFHFFGALSANPLWHGPLARRVATLLHTQRGGMILNFFWHSSEMMPQGSPHIRDQKAADKLLASIFSFCKWLRSTFDVHPVTATQLASLPVEYPTIFCCDNHGRDW